MIIPAALLTDTKRLVRSLVDDLRAASVADPAAKAKVDTEWGKALAAERTGLSRTAWEDGLYAQVAVGWVLAAVFVRFCEDNRLVTVNRLGGIGDQLKLARERRGEYLAANPSHDDRHWLTHTFQEFAKFRAAASLFGDHNPVWFLAPSADGASDIVKLFAETDADGKGSRHDFTDLAWDTRFLGDLYQDLSEHAKKQFALLQTPSFVEEFILDRTLTPALGTFGVDDVTLIDPTCGSGHFLLGAFHRLVTALRAKHPEWPAVAVAEKALDAIAGVDINPFAVAIARFRLLLAAMRVSGHTTLTDSPAYEANVVVGDSLLHGDRPGRIAQLLGDASVAASRHGYTFEDIDKADQILSKRWHVVVGNPPYITPKDPALRNLYRQRYSETCSGKYSLGVPFTEQFFWLAHPAGPNLTERNVERAGYVGMITANSFMKRSFGKKLIEGFLPTVDLTHVIDTSGAYIPGHGTPTVILLGRHRSQRSSELRAVLGTRGEPGRPADPTKGLVWASIVENIDAPGTDTPFVSVLDMARERFAAHPWSIGGGGAAELKERLDTASAELRSRVSAIGITAVTGEDEAYTGLANHRSGDGMTGARQMLVVGDLVRDWEVGPSLLAVWTYDEDFEPVCSTSDLQMLWRHRASLSTRRRFGTPMLEKGLFWWEWQELYGTKLRTPLSIVFADVATHNHFVLDRGGNVFKQTAPVIKLPAGATEDDHLALLGVLNSSAACFWLQQVCHNKGSTVDSAGARQTGEAYDNYFAHDGTKLQKFPLPPGSALDYGQRLDDLAQRLAATSPAAVVDSSVPTPAMLATGRAEWYRIRREMIACQEELDWHVYGLYGLADASLTYAGHPTELALGERAFEIVLARKIADGDEESTWFTRHESTPITELPAHWSDDYRDLVIRRIDLIESERDIALVERAECKRRWKTEPWEKQQQAALKRWLLDRLESPTYWRSPEIVTTNRLAAMAQLDADFVSVAQIYFGRTDVDIPALIAELVSGEAVPFVAAGRYKESGLRKRAEWERTWDLQRAEDAIDARGALPEHHRDYLSATGVAAAKDALGPIGKPPEYKNVDFIGVAWSHRGKLDVPKERFISYPGLERPGDNSLAVGWAGWNHLERAQVLVTFYFANARNETERALPVLAGLAEVAPWVRQWHNDDNDDPALNRAGDAVANALAQFLRDHDLTADDLAAWRPAKSATARRNRTGTR
jgi:hypothetical protein